MVGVRFAGVNAAARQPHKVALGGTLDKACGSSSAAQRTRDANGISRRAVTRQPEQTPWARAMALSACFARAKRACAPPSRRQAPPFRGSTAHQAHALTHPDFLAS